MRERTREKLPKEVIQYLRKNGPSTCRQMTSDLNPQFNGNLVTSTISKVLVELESNG